MWIMLVLVFAQEGPMGVRGATGATGVTGAAGALGARGSKGPRGDRGDAGAMGAQGAPGWQGPRGDVGDRGYSSTDADKLWRSGFILLPAFNSCADYCANRARSIGNNWPYVCVGAKQGTDYISCSQVYPAIMPQVQCACWTVTR